MKDSELSDRPFSIFLLMAVFIIFTVTALACGYGDDFAAVDGEWYEYAFDRDGACPDGPLLNVVMPERRREGVNPYGPGMEQELLDRFLEGHNYRVRYTYAGSYDEAFSMLKAHKADLMIGFGSEPSFHPENIGRGPALSECYMTLVVLPDEDLRGFDLSNVHSDKVAYSANQLAVLEEQEGRAILLDPATYALLMPILPNLQTAGQLAEKTGYYWFWNQGNIMLNAELEKFWSDQETEILLAEVNERYYGFMPKRPMEGQLLEINRAIADSIGVYGEYINKASAENGIDPLLLSAVIFQESRFNPKARSHTGVRGIMQLTLPTADMLGVNRLDPEEAISGGARYLRSIYDSLEFVEDLGELDRWYLTLAGFNQGPTVMRRAVKAARDEGLSPDWATMRDYYGGLKKKGLAGTGFRPKEAVNYVDNVRYYYYVLSGLARIAWPEHQNLAAFLALR